MLYLFPNRVYLLKPRVFNAHTCTNPKFVRKLHANHHILTHWIQLYLWCNNRATILGNEAFDHFVIECLIFSLKRHWKKTSALCGKIWQISSVFVQFDLFKEKAWIQMCHSQVMVSRTYINIQQSIKTSLAFKFKVISCSTYITKV